MMNAAPGKYRNSSWLRFFLVIWIFAIPLMLNRYMIFTNLLNRVQISDFIFIFVLALSVAAFMKRLISPEFPKPAVPMIPIFISFFVSSLLSKNQIRSFSEFTILFYLMLASLITANLLKDRSNLKLAINAWVAISALISMLGLGGIILSHFNIDNPFVRHYPGFLNKKFRLISTMQLPNMTYSYLHVSFFIALFASMTESKNAKRALYAASLVIITAAIFFTFSRGWAALFLGLAVFTYPFRLKNRISRILCPIFFLLALSIFVIIQLLITYTTDLTFSAAFRYDQARVVDHTDDPKNRLFKEDYFFEIGRPYNRVDASITFLPTAYWYTKRTALELWSKNPLFGIGPGMFVDALKALRDSHRLGIPDDFPDLESHSTYFGTLAKEGLLGLLSLLLFFGSIIWGLVNAFKNTGDRYLGTLFLACLAAFAGFLIFGIDVDVLNMRWFWFLIGMSLAAIMISEET